MATAHAARHAENRATFVRSGLAATESWVAGSINHHATVPVVNVAGTRGRLCSPSACGGTRGRAADAADRCAYGITNEGPCRGPCRSSSPCRRTGAMAAQDNRAKASLYICRSSSGCWFATFSPAGAPCGKVAQACGPKDAQLETMAIIPNPGFVFRSDALTHLSPLPREHDRRRRGQSRGAWQSRRGQFLRRRGTGPFPPAPKADGPCRRLPPWPW
jgi:hypothetical protein